MAILPVVMPSSVPPSLTADPQAICIGELIISPPRPLPTSGLAGCKEDGSQEATEAPVHPAS